MTYINNWCFTGGTFGRKEFVVIILTVGFAILLIEIVRIEWFDTLGTGETVRMVVTTHCGDVVVL